MEEYDYIIVGAGSAGCVVANRLSADSTLRILLLEAGGIDTLAAIQIPRDYSSLQGTTLDWGYRTEPESQLSNRQIPMSRGKVLGGCSSINAMMYVRGNQADYDQWAQAGNPGWAFADVLPFFKDLENNQLGESEFNGIEGPLSVSCPQDPHPLSHQLIEAAVAAGHTYNPNFNGDSQIGAGYYLATIKQGKRHSASAAFLHPIQHRSNLRVELNAQVRRIDCHQQRAEGVIYIKDGLQRCVKVLREVILCAGAIDSPKLLMLSGIGPANTLKSFDIPVVMDLPGVGQHLQDHLTVSAIFSSYLPRTEMYSNGCEAGIFLDNQHSSGIPDIQIDGVLDFFNDPTNIAPNLALSPVGLHPKSRGFVTLRSADYQIPPLIQCNYLQTDEDLMPLLEGIQIVRELAQASAFKKSLGVEIAPGPSVQTRAALGAYIREQASTLWHPVGTCRMGIDELSVVDATLRVRGMANIRVIDASIMPTITSGNTNAPSLMIGAKGADLVLSEVISFYPQ